MGADRTFLALACVMGALGIAVGAFGAHALSGRLSASLLATFETGVRYHLFAVVGLIAAALAAGRWPDARAATAGGWLVFAGAIVFSGSLYALALTGQRVLGAVTPIGGVLAIAGWLSLAWAAWSTR